jgi:hypothetical protein
MRRSAFNDPIIENDADDLGLVEEFQEAGTEIYALVFEAGENGKHSFEIFQNEDGEQIVISEDCFDDFDHVKRYLDGWVNDVQKNY